MTVTPPAAGPQYGPPTGPVAGAPPLPPAGPPAFEWRYAPPPPRRSKLLAAGVLIAILLAVAALVVGIVDLTRSAPPTAAPMSVAPTTTAAASAGDTNAADHALCTAIAPLMAESDRLTNDYIKLGDAGTPARDAATPKFITDNQNWVSRAQPVLDQHPDISPFLRRTLQRFVDDTRLVMSDLDPGPLPAYIKALTSDSVGAYAGPLHVCDGVGVRW